MDTLSKDALVLLAMELDYADIIKFCQTSKKVDRYVCQNNDFWRNRLYKEYPFSRNLDTTNSRKLYREISNEIKNVNTFSTQDVLGFNTPVYIREELVNFLSQADLGVTKNHQIPINCLIQYSLSKGISTITILHKLIVRYLRKYIIEKNRFTVGNNMNNFLNKYLTQFEEDDIGKPGPFNRNNFSYMHMQPLITRLIIPTRELGVHQLKELELKTVPLANLQKVIA